VKKMGAERSQKLKAVITGASSGIGRAIAIEMAATGNSVCLVGRNQERLDQVAEVARRTARVVVYRADLTRDQAIIDLAQFIEKEFAALDVLFLCAGTLQRGTIETTAVEQLDMLYQSNLRSPFLLVQAFLPMLKSSRGQIVFMNSSQGLHATANTGLYAATKHALKALTDSLRLEVNPDGIRVLSLYPGRTATPMLKALYDERQPYRAELLLQPEDVAQTALASISLPRTAEITDVEIRPHVKSY
jgi:short-subunit dehydrogenase